MTLKITVTGCPATGTLGLTAGTSMGGSQTTGRGGIAAGNPPVHDGGFTLIGSMAGAPPMPGRSWAWHAGTAANVTPNASTIANRRLFIGFFLSNWCIATGPAQCQRPHETG